MSGPKRSDTTRSYSAFGELSEQTAFWQSVELYRASYEGFDGVNDLGQRDALGRIVRKVETVEGVQTTYTYSYTPGGALQEVNKDGQLVEQYSNDENGNRFLGPFGIVGAEVGGGQSITVRSYPRLLVRQG